MKEKKEKKQNGYFRHMAEAIKMELREHKSSFMVYLILRILVIVMLVLQVLNQNYENVFLCILTLLLLIVPSFVQVTFKIELPTTLEIIVLFFIFAAEILGEINEFYLLFPFWDTVLHTLNGFLAAAIGFSLVDLLNRSERPDIRNNIDINIGRHMGQLLHHFDPRPAPDSPVVCSSHDHFRDIAHDRVFRNLIRCILTIHRYDFCSQRLCQFQMAF